MEEIEAIRARGIDTIDIIDTGYSALRTLSDVDASDLQDGHIIIYNAISDKFITRNDPYNLTIDGGIF
jgi:hypothetical protein